MAFINVIDLITKIYLKLVKFFPSQFKLLELTHLLSNS